MTNGRRSHVPTMHGPAVYRIHVRGRLDARWSERLGGMQITGITGANGKPESVSQDRWPDYLSQVTAGNKGRHVAAVVIDPTAGSPESAGRRSSINVPLTDAPFLSLEYDPVNKGNAIIVSVGVDTVDYEHAIDAPVELTENLDPDGRLNSLEILDQNGARTKLNFFQLGRQSFAGKRKARTNVIF